MYWLTKPEESLAPAIAAYRQEQLEQGLGFEGISRLRDFADPLDFIRDARLFEREETLPVRSFVPATQFLCVHLPESTVVGVIQIRHRLNEHLLNYAGHIGYAVRPGWRKKGIAKWMLRMILPHCKALGLDRVLITCDKENEASRRTIEACGGVLEDIRMDGENAVLRYWIDLK